MSDVIVDTGEEISSQVTGSQDIFAAVSTEIVYADCVVAEQYVDVVISGIIPTNITIQEQIVIIQNIGEVYMTIAAIALSGHRVVGVNAEDKAEYASCDNIADAFKAYGVTTHAAEAGQNINIQMTGEIVEPSWNWIPSEPLFLGIDGALVQTVPSLPTFHLIIGWAVTATKIKLRIEEPVIAG